MNRIATLLGFVKVIFGILVVTPILALRIATKKFKSMLGKSIKDEKSKANTNKAD